VPNSISGSAKVLMKSGSDRRLTYAKVGIERKTREKSQQSIQSLLHREANRYQFDKPLDLPFGKVFPLPQLSDQYFDFQIEGVGTKTLLAELSRKYDTIGIDGVAMAVNDVMRSGSDPVFLSDGIHISKSDPAVLNSILSGVEKGAQISGCSLVSGETGDVGEILHGSIANGSSPFDLFVSCLGILERKNAITGHISKGDVVIGLQSSGIHSNGITLARKVLLKKWGGLYDLYDQPGYLERPVIDELLEPTRIYVRAIQTLRKEEIRIRAAVHITGDGLAKFSRLLRVQRRRNGDLGLRLNLFGRPPIFDLILDAAKQKGMPIPIVEMFRTFNMGIGFAIIVSPKDSRGAIDSLNNECQAQNIGLVSSDGRISIKTGYSKDPILL